MYDIHCEAWARYPSNQSRQPDKPTGRVLVGLLALIWLYYMFAALLRRSRRAEASYNASRKWQKILYEIVDSNY